MFSIAPDQIKRQWWVLLLVMGLVPGRVLASGRQPALLLTPVASEKSASFHFRCVTDGEQGAYAVWTHTAADGTSKLLAQRLGLSALPSAGVINSPSAPTQPTALWSEPVVVAPKVSAPHGWDAFADGQNGLILVWEVDSHIQAQRYDPDGKSSWPTDPYTVSASSFPQTLPVGATDGAGGAYLVWSEKRYADRSVLMAQHINALGARLWPSEGMRPSLRPSGQRSPSIVPDALGGAVFAWKDFREQASQLQTQRMDFQGNLLWGQQGVVVTAPASEGNRPPITAAVGNGAVVLAWEGESRAASRILMQRLDAAGNLIWAPQGLDAAPGAWDEWNPVLYGDGQEGVWVGWEDYRDGVNWNVFLVRLRKDGHPAWPKGEIALAPIRADEGHLALTDDGRQGVFAAWLDNRAGKAGLYLQEVDARGQRLLGATGATLSGSLRNPLTPQLVALAPGRVLATWADEISRGHWLLFARPYVAD